MEEKEFAHKQTNKPGRAYIMHAIKLNSTHIHTHWRDENCLRNKTTEATI